ncbi:MAG TPA: amylo-alpha-1,6-glucosidase [Acidobacteriaceae bacterium]|nr:amylo-alpha-1,6-glucosidase [Acidobacteriaceae bacterium]
MQRSVRPWEFADAVGQQSAFLGHESGAFEAWVYPLKILRDLHLQFEIDKHSIDGQALVRSIETRPESTTLTYAYDDFQVKETFFAPLHQPGLVIQLAVQSRKPLGISLLFHHDFELAWPASMSSSDMEWNAPLHAFVFNESEHHYAAVFGSPSAVDGAEEYANYYSSSNEDRIDLGSISGTATRTLAIAASLHSLPDAEATYRNLLADYPQLFAESAAYYRNYLDSHLQLDLPDAALQQSYQWAQISTVQALETNPYLGSGLIAGYGLSGNGGRPGFNWFFGRDALWTSLALNAEGDFTTTRTALNFLAKYQRADGKITHEIAQTASLVPWFDKLPYAYASADATPLFLIAIDDYMRRSGDTNFAAEHWDNIIRAYKFLRSTYDPDGFPRNLGVGHGWVEGGPLLPIKSEFYQSGLAVEAMRALDALAHATGKTEGLESLGTDEAQAQKALNQAFWLPQQQRYAYALDEKNAQVDAPSVLTAVPMWFGLLDAEKADAMIKELASPELHTDWGMRILASSHPKYDPACYHCGTVWPLFTGWASVGEYRYHATLPAYANLRSNALLAFDGSLGHTAEVLSGDYYQPLATGTPHQIWSSAMVISSMLNGLFGLETDAAAHRVTITPHLPADWTHFAMRHIEAGPCQISIGFTKTLDSLTYAITHQSGANCSITLAPAISLHAQVTNVTVNGSRVDFKLNPSSQDQHPTVTLKLSNSSTTTQAVFHLRNAFDLTQQITLPALGSTSQALNVLSQNWNTAHDTLTLDLSTAGSGSYELIIWNPAQIQNVEGATLSAKGTETGLLHITVPAHPGTAMQHQQLVLHLGASATKRRQ